MSGSISPSPQIVQATPNLRFSGTQCTPILAHVSTCLCTVPALWSCKQQNRPALSDNSETVGAASGSRAEDAFPEDPRSPARLRVVLGIERSLLLGRGDTTGAQRSQGNDPIRFIFTTKALESAVNVALLKITGGDVFAGMAKADQ